MTPSKTPNTKFLLAINGVSICLLAISIFTLVSAFNTPRPNQQVLGENEAKASASSVKIPKMPKPDSLSLNTAFFGDVFWGRRIHKWSQASELKQAYPFSGLSSFGREKYDAWIANLECPLTNEILTEYQEEEELKFNCSPEYLTEASKWFNAFSLSNNHMDNMEEVDGLKKTRENLTKNNIQFFGHYETEVIDDVCEVVSFKARPNLTPEKQAQAAKIEQLQKQAGTSSATSESETTSSKPNEFYVPIALCSYHNVFKLPSQESLAQISLYSKYFPTIVMPHQGAEYTTTADQLQVEYYRAMVDLGADVVLGNHPHSVHNTESYNGKLIVYSMGNFMFDQQDDPIVTQGIGTGLNFQFDFDENMQKLSQVNEACTQFKDKCLEKAQKSELAKPKFNLEYSLIASDNSGKLVKKADEAVYNQMLERTNWEVTTPNLKTRWE